jgi:hypothetical protein
VNILGKSAVLGAIAFTAFLSSANADEQVAQTAGAAAAVTLPEVIVHPNHENDPRYYDPYVGSQHGPRASSEQNIPAGHYKVPVGYDSNVSMHPYTSLIGPCPEGATPSQGCRHPTGTPITPSHYERAPFNQ